MKGTDFDRALKVALHAHAGSVDKAGLPYILHPVRVAERVIRYSGLPSPLLSLAAVAALLHDVIEDGPAGCADAVRELGDEVYEAVLLLTREKGVEPYLDYVRRIAQAEGPAARIARAVKLADLADNLDSVRRASLAGQLEGRYVAAREVILQACRVKGESPGRGGGPAATR